MSPLFQPFQLNSITLANRVVMAPMTRSRAPDTVPDDLTVLYYQQRASAGLIITEGAPISDEGRGYLYTPGIHTPAQVAGWSKVTEAVHQAGGRIFVQLWHVGRVSHPSLQPNGGLPVAPSAVPAPNSHSFSLDAEGRPGNQPVPTPRALETAEVARITGDFVHAAKMAIEAGFDGVELHGANGYLIDQFISPATNHRTDQFGGSVENRLRFLTETMDAVCAAIGPDRVGLRLSPFGRLSDMAGFEGETDTWLAVAATCAARNLAYLHLSDQLTIGGERIPPSFAKEFRSAYPGTLIAAGGFDFASAEAALAAGDLDLVAFGKPYISNPDLVERMKNSWPITTPSRASFYENEGPRGYTDYRAYAEPQYFGGLLTQQ